MENVLFRRAESTTVITVNRIRTPLCFPQTVLVPMATETLGQFGTSDAGELKPSDDSSKSSFPSLFIIISSENLSI